MADRSCFNCNNFPNCSILRKSRIGEYGNLDGLFVTEYGKYCVDFVEK